MDLLSIINEYKFDNYDNYINYEFFAETLPNIDSYKCSSDNDINYLKIPVTYLYINDEDDRALFNKVADYLVNSTYRNIRRTKSGGISKNNIYYNGEYDIRDFNTNFEITFHNWLFAFRLSIGVRKNKEENKITGKKALKELKERAKLYGIDLDKYATNNDCKTLKIINGDAVHYRVNAYIKHDENSEWLDNVHHIDYHSAFPGGLKKAHPEFTPLIDNLYRNRKFDNNIKAILNYSIGSMWSEHVYNGKYVQLAIDAISTFNRDIDNLVSKLRLSGRRVLVTNTDGVWYQGDIYHNADLNEGKNCGQWENDHVNCKIRVKSARCYEYIEDDKLTVVCSGFTNLDKVKPREQWEPGDIFNNSCKIIKYKLINNKLEKVIDNE